MKNVAFIWLGILWLLTVLPVMGQETVVNNAFKTGERLEYRVYYHSGVGNLTAGEAILTVKDWSEKYTTDEKTVYHFTGEGNSLGLFNFFFKVRDKFQSFADKQTLLPYVFLRETREGKFEMDDKVTFNREKGESVSLSETKQIPDNVHDIISALYYMRTLSVSDFDADSMFQINFFLDDSVYTSAVKYMGTGHLKTKWGKIRCLKFAPMMATGEVFAEKYPMFVWVSDDENHVPIMGESEVVVGSVKMELIHYSGLATPLDFSQK